MTAGIEVNDIGLALSPVAYFAQFDLDIPCVAMVTASHNENGWTGVKMGAATSRLTFGPDEMGRLKEIVLSGRGPQRVPGRRRINGSRACASVISTDVVSGRRRNQARPESRRRLRQRHGRRLSRPNALSRLGDRGDPHGRGTRPYVPEIQSEPRRSWKCCTPWSGRGARTRGRRRPRLRRRRRPLRRRRRRRREEIFADKIGVLLARDLSKPQSRRAIRGRRESRPGSS